MRSIKTKLSSAMILLVLLTVTVISLLSNYLIDKQFTEYIARQQELRAKVISATISQQYTKLTREWDLEYIHTVGMFSLYEGYILKVYDDQKQILWDAEAHDMNLCNQIMDDISERMRIKYPQNEGEFTATTYPLIQSGVTVGSISISYFGPFFLTENDFRFLDSLNKVLMGVGFTSLLLSVVIGSILAKRISRPILKTVDVTKKIADGNYEVRLEEKTDTLEINMLIDSINHLAYSLENMEKLRQRLTEDVAHELRTPITILLSHIEAMMEGIWEPTKERLQSCYEETIRISKLVNDLQQLATLESDNLKLNKTVFPLYELLNEAVNGFEGQLAENKLRVTIQGPEITVNADKGRLEQVLVNLLSNAVKYSEGGGCIIFETFETEDSAGFYIKDDGNGIPEEELPFIFERFYRADKSRNRLTGGTGIGLTIVKSIVGAHGGRVKVKSRLNEGSTFTIILPME
ncbi:MAG TPA: ATP-binding protein [Mobilitalea sp.]|nr:ATP-binding protein [Mobilitalea sp.]